MTAHLGYDHKCEVCGESYFPFDEENRNCPKCGMPAKEIEPLMPDIVSAALYNIPWGVFSVCSTGDRYVMWAMQSLERITKADIDIMKDEQGLNVVTDKLLAFFVFKKDHEYKVPHIRFFIKAMLKEASAAKYERQFSLINDLKER